MKKLIYLGLTSLMFLGLITNLNAQSTYVDEDGVEYREITKLSDIVGIPGVVVSKKGITLEEGTSLLSFIETGEGGDIQMDIVAGGSRARTATNSDGFKSCKWAPWKGCLESCTTFSMVENDPIINWGKCNSLERGEEFIKIKEGDRVFYNDKMGDFIVMPN